MSGVPSSTGMSNSRMGLAFAAAVPNNSNQYDANNEQTTSQEEEGGDGEGKPLELPASDPDADIPSIQLGESIRFEEMGPVILNLDGSTRRIENWNEMTKAEQQVAWRRIAKRNEQRRKVLVDQMEQAEAAAAAAAAEAAGEQQNTKDEL